MKARKREDVKQYKCNESKNEYEEVLKSIEKLNKSINELIDVINHSYIVQYPSPFVPYVDPYTNPYINPYVSPYITPYTEDDFTNNPYVNAPFVTYL